MTTSPGATTYTENDANTPVAVDPGLTLTDPDSPTMAAAIVTINGAKAGDKLTCTPAAGSLINLQGGSTDTQLVLVGPGTRADYEAALQSITFVSPGDNPVAGERTISFSVYDDQGYANTNTKTLTVVAVNDAPTVTTSPGATTYTENDANTPVAVDPGLTLTDPDSPTMAAAIVTINGAKAGDKLTYTPAAGSLINLQGGSTDTQLVLVGPGTRADYEAALQSITFVSPGDNPVAGERTISFSVYDDQGYANTNTKTLTVVAVNDAPTVTTSPGATTYTENDANTPVAVDPGLTLTDPDSPTMAAAIVTINGAKAGDKLTYTPAAGSLINLQGGSTDTQLVLVGPGTRADYEAALQSITFVSPGDNPVAGERTISFSVYDDQGYANTNTKTLTVVAVNDAPTVTTSPGATTYTENDANTPVAVDPGSDPDRSGLPDHGRSHRHHQRRQSRRQADLHPGGGQPHQPARRQHRHPTGPRRARHPRRLRSRAAEHHLRQPRRQPRRR